MTRGRKANGTYPLGALDAAGLRAQSLWYEPDRSPRDHKLAGLPEVTSVRVTNGARLFCARIGACKASSRDEAGTDLSYRAGESSWVYGVGLPVLWRYFFQVREGVRVVLTGFMTSSVISHAIHKDTSATYFIDRAICTSVARSKFRVHNRITIPSSVEKIRLMNEVSCGFTDIPVKPLLPLIEISCLDSSLSTYSKNVGCPFSWRCSIFCWMIATQGEEECISPKL